MEYYLEVLIQLRCRANIASSEPFCCITVEDKCIDSLEHAMKLPVK